MLFRTTTPAVALLAALAAGPSPIAAAAPQDADGAADRGARYEALIDEVAPSIVTLRMVVKLERSFGGRSSDGEVRNEVSGALVTPDGMILCSYDPFRSVETEQFSVKVTPLEIKVVFEREEKEYDAALVATDKKVNLAFVKVKDLEGREVRVIDFSSPAGLSVGAGVHQVGRMAKGYDYAPYVMRSVVNGRLKKPRKAWMLDGSVSLTGLPVFDGAGMVAGVLTELDSGLSDSESAFAGMSGRPFVLDAKIIARLIEQAQKQAAELREDGAATDVEAADDGGDGEEGGGR